MPDVSYSTYLFPLQPDDQQINKYYIHNFNRTTKPVQYSSCM